MKSLVTVGRTSSLEQPALFTLDLLNLLLTLTQFLPHQLDFFSHSSIQKFVILLNIGRKSLCDGQMNTLYNFVKILQNNITMLAPCQCCQYCELCKRVRETSLEQMFTDTALACCTCSSEDLEKGGQEKPLHHPRQKSNTKYF